MKNIIGVNRTLVFSNVTPLQSGDVTSLTQGKPVILTKNSTGTGTRAVTLAASGETVQPEIKIGVGLSTGYRETGGWIKAKNIREVNTACYTAGVSKMIEFSDLCSECNGEFGISFNITSSSAWTEYGFNLLKKSFTSTPACCTGTDGNVLTLLQDFIDQLNNDPDGIFEAYAIDPDDSGDPAATALTSSELAAWDVSADGTPSLVVIFNPIALADFCGIPNLYSWPTGVNVEAATYGFTCCSPASATTTIQDIVYPIGEGIDAKYAEYYDASNADGDTYPLTVSGVTSATKLNADATVNYNIVTITYDEPIGADYGNYSDPKSVTIYAPYQGSNLANFWTILDQQLAGYPTAIATAITACNA